MIAEGAERSELVLDAAAFSPHSGLLSPPSTVEDLH
jgi:hypothetical protein